jgi:peroxiredoxin family protein
MDLEKCKTMIKQCLEREIGKIEKIDSLERFDTRLDVIIQACQSTKSLLGVKDER